MKKMMMSLLAAGSALTLFAGFLDKPVVPASYVPGDSRMVGFVDSQRFLDNAQMQTLFGELKTQLGFDVNKELEDSLAAENLKLDDIKGKFYFFDIVSAEAGEEAATPQAIAESSAFGILLLTEGGKAQKLFQQSVDEVKAKDDEFEETPLGGFATLTDPNGSMVLLTPDALFFFRNAETEQIEAVLKGEGKNPLADGLAAEATVLTFRGKPDPRFQDKAPMTFTDLTITEKAGDMDVLVHGEMESEDAAKEQMKSIQAQMAQLQMFAFLKPELAPMIQQISVKNNGKSIDVSIPKAVSMTQNLLQALGAAQQMQQQMQQQMMQGATK